jgi:penicillin amidase
MTRLIPFLVLHLACTGEEDSAPDEYALNTDPVQITTDSMGIPHIYAQSDTDLFHAAGYQMAVDRLFQAEMLLRFSHGTLAEVLGETGRARDESSRIFDLSTLAEADREWMETHDPQRAELFRVWVGGINRRVAQIRSGEVDRPFGYRADDLDFMPMYWTEDDPYVVLKGANIAIDMTLEFEIAVSLVDSIYPEVLDGIELFRPGRQVFSVPTEELPSEATSPVESRAERDSTWPDLEAIPPGLLEALKTLPSAQGSNNWAVDGRWTDNGSSLIAGDPHMGFDFFGSPWPVHLNSKDGGGSYDVAGFSFPGTPGVALGHTDAVVWTATSSFADVMDVWAVERVDDQVQIGDQLHDIQTRTEEFRVRGSGQAVGEGTTHTVEYESVEGVGILLPSFALPLPVGDYLVRWTGMEARRASWFMELNDVGNIDEFEDAVDRMEEMNYNLVAASADEISYRVGVQVPDRGQAGGEITPWMAMNGSAEETWWTGERLDAEQRPRARGDEQGWLVTANNDPFGFTADGSLDNDPWYYGSLYAPGYRAQRIEEELGRLTEAGPLSMDDMLELQRDVHSPLADDLLPLLEEAWAAREGDESLTDYAENADLAALVELLSTWDRQVARDSAGALAFHMFLHQVTGEVLRDDIALAYQLAMELKPVFIIKLAVLALQGEYPDTEVLQDGRNIALLEAGAQTAAWLVEQFGSIDSEAFSLSTLKVTDFDHALGYGMALEARPTDGGEDTINVAQDILTPDDGSQWASSHVSVERLVAGFDESGVPEAWVSFPYASAADPDSTESQVAMETYVEGEARRLLFDTAEVQADTVQTDVLPAR